MISKIKLCFKHQTRIDRFKNIKFQSGINVVIGPNGSGKSSLLKAIVQCRDCKRSHDAVTKYHYFNSETMNPHRHSKYLKGVIGSVIKVRAMFSSHGETMRDVLRHFQFKPGDCFLLDEPEDGHDLQWIIRIYNGLKKINSLGCQVVVASHHPVFLKDSNIVELKRGYLKRIMKLMGEYTDGNSRKIK